jgi:hypothetical protein
MAVIAAPDKSVKVTVNGATPLVGSPEKSATGSNDTNGVSEAVIYWVLVVVLDPSAFVAFSETV